MRSDAREAVFKIVFSSLFNQDCGEEFVKSIYKECKLSEQDVLFAEKLLNTVTDNIQDILAEISVLSEKYKLDRIYTADKCALIIGICELKYFDDVPHIVAIDQAMMLARKYSADTSLNFVNGVLAEYKKKIEV